MNKEALKQAALDFIEADSETLMEYGRTLFSTPEPGFREEKTSRLVKSALEDCGLSVRDGIALTGLKAKAEGANHQANVAVMGELDCLIMPTHPKAQPETGYYHGCGHHAQLTTILGVAMGLVKSGLIKELDGDVTFIGVPAEEVIELEYRSDLIKQGRIEFMSGKQELIRLGEFDDVDMVLCSHAMGKSEAAGSWLGHSWNGVIHKSVQYTGRSAHAGLAPERGINALQAALMGMNGVNALRERFRDEDHVRIHYIITKGGSSPNIVPDDVRMEFGVRAASVESIKTANEQVNGALRLGGEAVGAGVNVNDYGMYLPCHQSWALGEIFLKNAENLIGPENVHNCFAEHRGSSTDCGDVASLLPLIHPYFGGAVGVPHGLDFDIVNDYAAYVVPAKLAAATVIDLLWDGAALAKKVRAEFRPDFGSKEEYLEFSRTVLA